MYCICNVLASMKAILLYTVYTVYTKTLQPIQREFYCMKCFIRYTKEKPLYMMKSLYIQGFPLLLPLKSLKSYKSL